MKRVDGVTARQERAIAALVVEPTVLKASQTARVGLRTLHRWLDDPAFSRTYRRARREAFGQAIGLVQRYAPAAVNALARVIADAGTPAASRVAAAVALLKFARELLELDDLAARIEALELAARETTR
ncbi:MAG: hypothetical protein HRU70_10610 [Phycisphaeraceae bacterium]|nr:MAG: hypothetical protein HRU70_10610 [Phycisphaeraceae bacterium]